MSDKKLIKHTETELGSPLEGYMRTMFTQLMAAMARNLRHDNLSLAQVAALHLVDLNKEMRVGELAAELAMQLPGASKLANELVDRGLFRRREDATDRRVKVLSLSKKGVALVERLARQRIAEATVAMASAGGEVGETFNTMFVRFSGDRKTPGPNEPGGSTPAEQKP